MDCQYPEFELELEEDQIFEIEDDETIYVRFRDIRGEVEENQKLVDYIDSHGGKIDSIKVNGEELPIEDKTVDISVPTKTSDLTNDSGFIDSTALEGYATEEYVNNHHDSTKQDTIDDLDDIRTGAQAGSTAVQPAVISDMATQTWVESQGYLTEHQSLANYDTKSEVDAKIANHHDSTKQDNITDLDDIRSGAELGSSSIQPNDNITKLTNNAGYITSSALSGYATEQYVNNHHDTTKQDTITDLEDIREGAQAGHTAVQPADISDMATKTWAGQQGWQNSTQVDDKISTHNTSTTAHQDIRNAIPQIVDNVTSTDANKGLSANQGKLLNDRINNIAGRGRFLSLWNCVTGLPLTNPSGYPYTYHTGDFFIVNNTGETNYIPNGSEYSGQPSTTVYTGKIKVNDTIFYDGTSWMVFDTPAGTGDVQDVYQNGESVLSEGIAYIVTPTKVSDLTNDEGYITGISGSDVTTALGYTPYNSTNPNGYISGIDSSDVTTALGYTPYNSTNPSGYQNASQVDNAITAKGYTTMGEVEAKGYITGIDGEDVTDALGYTPYNSTNPSGYQTSQQVETAITSKGYITGITGSDVTTALGYTPYDSANPSGYQTSQQVETAITSKGYITSAAISDMATQTWVSQQGFASEDDLADVAFSGDYTALLNKPTLPRKVVL